MATILKRNISLLVGNGLSISVNNNLALPKLSELIKGEILQNLKEGSQIIDLMHAMSERTDRVGSHKGNFEELIGEFHHQSLGMKSLKGLVESAFIGNVDLLKAVNDVEDITSRIGNLARYASLRVIFREATQPYMDRQNLYEFVDKILETFDGKISFGNLNYDPLLLAALTNSFPGEFSDLADGRRDHIKMVDVNGSLYRGRKLREKHSLLPGGRRVSLWHLHGSLNYWHELDSQTAFKLETSDVRNSGILDYASTKSAKYEPLVVLTKGALKQGQIDKFPFNLAYATFQDSLVSSSRWIIAGYDFGDISVNAMLAQAVISRKAENGNLQILVITKNKDLSKARILNKLKRANSSMRISKNRINVIFEGIEGLESSPVWETFSATEPAAL